MPQHTHELLVRGLLQLVRVQGEGGRVASVCDTTFRTVAASGAVIDIGSTAFLPTTKTRSIKICTGEQDVKQCRRRKQIYSPNSPERRFTISWTIVYRVGGKVSHSPESLCSVQFLGLFQKHGHQRRKPTNRRGPGVNVLPCCLNMRIARAAVVCFMPKPYTKLEPEYYYYYLVRTSIGNRTKGLKCWIASGDPSK